MFFDLDTLLRVLRLLFRPSTFTFRRLFVVGGFLVLVTLLNVFVKLFQALDHIFYPRFRDTQVERPLFVIANPRSGTTFLHRLMCLDEERFTYIKLWQTIFPSVTFYRLVATVGRFDAIVGAPLAKLLHFAERKIFKGWDGVHHVGWSAAEEEEFIFISSLLSPDALIILPFPLEMRQSDFLDRLPARKREAVMRHYKGSVQRHVFATGNNRIYLSKNVFFGGRLQSIVDTFPDAQFVHLVRHPYSSLASMISMFSAPWALHSPEIPKNSPEHRYWAELGMEYYQHMLDHSDAIAGDRFITYTYEQLVGDPKGTVEDIYRRLDIPMSPAFRRRLDEETRKAARYQSGHDYSLSEYGLDEETVYNQIPEVFERYGFEKHPVQEPSSGGIDAGVGVAELQRSQTDEQTSRQRLVGARRSASPSALA